jgi:predicted glycosyltransferase
MRNRRLTVVGYAVNGSGLGHLTRTVAIFRWLRRLTKLAGIELDAHILTSSEAPGLAFEEGFATWKIPSKTIVKETEIDKAAFLRLARQWVWHTLGLIDPDLLLVDTFPAGSFGELLYALDGPGKKVLVRRAVKESFEAQTKTAPLLRSYDLILIPSENGAASPPSLDGVDERTKFLGPIMLRSREDLRPREDARRRLGIPEQKTAVYLTAGGGGDTGAKSSLDSMIQTLSENPALHLVVGAGPLYRGEPRRAHNITWLTSFKASEDFAAIDLAVSAAGFNSYHELLNAGVPTAFFSQDKIADGQDARAQRAASAGAALYFEPADFRETVNQLVSNPGLRARLSEQARAFVPHNYAREAAYHALSSVLGKEALRTPMEVGTPAFFNRLNETGATVEDVRNASRHMPDNFFPDAEERASIALSLFDPGSVPPDFSALVCKDFCGLFAPSESEDEAEEAIAAARELATALLPYGPITTARSLISALAPSAAGLNAQGAARRWSEKLRGWWEEGESAASVKFKIAAETQPPPAQPQTRAVAAEET